MAKTIRKHSEFNDPVVFINLFIYPLNYSQKQDFNRKSGSEPNSVLDLTKQETKFN